MLNIKQGQGNIIAWVLLVGFAIGLAVFVGRWSLQQSQKATEGIVDRGEADIRCENIAISVECDGADYIVRNKGSLKIVGLNVGGCEGTTEIGTKDENWFIGLNDFKKISFSDCDDVITLIPMIMIEGKLVGCSTKDIDIKKCGL